MVLEARIQEKLKRPVRIPTTTDILLNPASPGFIRPSDHVLVVGPGIDLYPGSEATMIPMDRALMALPGYLANGGGKITVLDAPTQVRGFSIGFHNIELVKKWLEYASTLTPSCPIEYKEAILLKDELNFPSQFDSINDHLTTFGSLLMYSDENSAKEISRKIIDIYDSALKPGGKMIIHYDEPESFRRSSLISAMEEKNLAVTDIFPLRDTYEIPRLIKEELLKDPYYRTLFDRNGRMASFHKSKGILIGQKTDS